VTGNHEYYRGMQNFLQLTQMPNIYRLKHQMIKLDNGIQIAGIDDSEDSTDGGVYLRIRSALKNCDTNKPIIFLSHKPLYYKQAQEMGVDLMLSGHVHAGQIFPYNFFVKLLFKYDYGLRKYKTMYIYTTSGTGFWGPPMRNFSRCEIVKIEFRPETKN